MEEIRLGTIGTGKIVHDILDQVMRTEGITHTAVYSRSKEKGSGLAEAYGAGVVFTDLEAFFSSESFNTVYIASPNSLHYEHAKQALLHGKHVICEKPMCPTKREVDELIALADERGLILVDATPMTFTPNYAILKRELPKIGRLRLVMTNYSQYSSRYDSLLAGEVANVFSPAFAGGSLMDINYYNAYFCVSLFGSPEQAVYFPNLCSTGVDTSGLLVMRYPDHICENAGAKDTKGVNYAQLEGETGFIYVEDGVNTFGKVRVVTGSEDSTFDLQNGEDRRLFEIREVAAAMLAEDRESLSSRLSITREVIGLIEQVRKEAGIRFAGE